MEKIYFGDLAKIVSENENVKIEINEIADKAKSMQVGHYTTANLKSLDNECIAVCRCEDRIEMKLLYELI